MHEQPRRIDAIARARELAHELEIAAAVGEHRRPDALGPVGTEA
jgi:hypothetical protein